MGKANNNNKKKGNNASKGQQKKKSGAKAVVKKQQQPQKKTATPVAAPAAQKNKKGMSGLQQKMSAKLHGAHFRWLNEELYTNTAARNFARFTAEPELADAYHRGFREQARNWPENPLDAIIAWLKARKKKCRVADFGCGEARLAAELVGVHQVDSFDLVATNERVVACNMAATPLAAGTADVAVFCLALMGPSWPDFLKEAHRTLRLKGVLKIAEVRSRFDEQAGGFSAFVAAVTALGFVLLKRDVTNTFFVSFDFLKADAPPSSSNTGGGKNKTPFDFKPCLYKRR